MTIDLSDKDAAVLASQARAARMPPERYLSEIVAHALERRQRHAAAQLEAHLDAMAVQVQPETTAEQMEIAIEAALAAVRPRRGWQPGGLFSIPIFLPAPIPKPVLKGSPAIC